LVIHCSDDTSNRRKRRDVRQFRSRSSLQTD
jgi:hypothetical protein